jgi:hypothetical protein
VRAIRENLFQRLSAQGLAHFEILRIVKDVLNLIGDGGDFTLPYINGGPKVDQKWRFEGVPV